MNSHQSRTIVFPNNTLFLKNELIISMCVCEREKESWKEMVYAVMNFQDFSFKERVSNQEKILYMRKFKRAGKKDSI